MNKKMVKKGLSLPESHRQAISDGLERYYSMNEMSQERKDNISAGQKKRLAKRDVSQIQAHKDAISKGARKYYETHDGPWSGISHSETTKHKISEGLREYWKKKKLERKHVVEWWER